MSDRQKTCAERWREQKDSTFGDLRTLWDAYCNGEEYVEDLGNIFEYGLSFDYVSPGTFGEEQTDGYFRYQLSWGGPSDEIRYYADPDDCEDGADYIHPRRITYVFRDWFDGEERGLNGGDHALALDLFEWFKEGGAVEAEFDKAIRE
jgi:hypothetical protein